MSRMKSCWNMFFSGVLMYTFLTLIAVWLLFENIIVCIIITLCVSPVFIVIFRKYVENKRQQQIENEFFKLLSNVSMSMSSGMILENALKETISVDIKDYTVLSNDLGKMYRMLQNNYSIESAFRQLAQSSNNKEIKFFYEVLTVSKPMGVDLTELIRYMSSAYRMRADTESEITRILNAPKYNNRAVMIMPFVCIALFRQMAPTYMDSLYVGTGRIVMVVVAILLVLAFWLGEKIGDVSY